MREIVFDTETTGLDPRAGHRVVEIGCVELVNHVATGETFHCYINPQRDMPTEAENVHGLSEAFLADKPVFADVAEDFVAFVGDAALIAHNAPFDMGFVNAELEETGRTALSMDKVIDTVQLARRKFPGAQVNLDALCRRFNIDRSARIKHGALLDAELLAEVYLELIGGREPGLGLAASQASTSVSNTKKVERTKREPRPHAASDTELAAHALFLEKLKNPLWTA